MYIIYGMKKFWIFLSLNLILLGCTQTEDAKIAYLSVDASQMPLLHGDLYVMDVGGANKTHLATTHKVVNFLCWGPKAERIAYVGLNPDTLAQNLYIIDSDGGNEMQVTDNEDHKKHIMLSAGCWNEDGKKILYAMMRNRIEFEDTDIFEVMADGSSMTKLDLKGVGVSWASRGDNILVNTNRTTSTGRLVTYVVESAQKAAGAGVVSNGVELRCGVRSFKDERLICNGARNRQNQRQILFLDVGSREEIPVSKWPVSGQEELIFTHMDWSPNNGKITYTGLHLLNKEVDVYIMTTEGLGNSKLMDDSQTCCAAWSDR